MNRRSIAARLLSAGAAVCFALSSGGVGASASAAVKSGNFEYRLENGKAVLVSCSVTGADILAVPAVIDGYEVKGAASGFLSSRNKVSVVVFPNSEAFTTLGSRAINLAEVNMVVMSPKLTYISDDAILTKAMYLQRCKELDLDQNSFGDLGEADLLVPIRQGESTMGSTLTVKYMKFSPAETYAERIGASKVLLAGYTGKHGDVNCDGKVNNRDIKTLQVFQTYSNRAGMVNPSMDVNGDGHYNNSDLKALQNYLVGSDVTIY